MCTLVLGYQLDRRWPIVVAANRDEQLDRPSEGWAVRGPAAAGLGRIPWPVCAAPLDVQAGGTWVGVSARGLFAGVTNHFVRLGWKPDRTRRSRGDLVPLALAAGSAADAARSLAALDAAAWNPFHLLVADAAAAFLWWYDGEEQGMTPLDPGLHVVTERDREGRGPRAERLRARWPAEPSLPRLRELLVHHGDAAPGGGVDELLRVLDRGDATCIHGDPVYGTRSSAILRLARDLAASDLLVAEARPCVTPHEDRSELLVALARRA
ncbi:MAG TPA: NRDE family protein [Anaeromyxobacter sp.]|nr:NRDE family protein [Anaeromyxobacter sp.]